MDNGDQPQQASPIVKPEKGFKSDGLKQRLIGAIVLVSLAVIFLPMIFDQPHQEKKNIVIPIPERPPEKLVTFEAPKPPNLKGAHGNAQSLEVIHSNGVVPAADSRMADDEPESMSAAQPDLAKPLATMSTKVMSTKVMSTKVMPAKVKQADIESAPVTDSKVSTPQRDENLPKSLEQAWIVQLGTFGNKENALKLRDKARAQGYSTHTAELVRDGKTLTRVFSGPFIDRADADKVKVLLDKKFSVKSMVVKFSE